MQQPSRCRCSMFEPPTIPYIDKNMITLIQYYDANLPALLVIGAAMTRCGVGPRISCPIARFIDGGEFEFI
jgi:hypothetical protein